MFVLRCTQFIRNECAQSNARKAMPEPEGRARARKTFKFTTKRALSMCARAPVVCTFNSTLKIDKLKMMSPAECRVKKSRDNAD